ncbi:MAG: maleylpyruvate isomerase N-terminal domain-containing protein [Dehalococcoidia bacterium]
MAQTSAPGVPAVPDRAELRAAIERARTSYNALVDTVPADAWRSPSTNAGWDCGKLLAHVAVGQEYLSTVV